MKRIVLSIILLSVWMTSCTNELDEINTDHNNPQEVPPSLLLPTVIFDIADLLVLENYDFANIVGQYSANYEFNEIDIFNWTSDDRYWTLYASIQNAHDIKQLGIAEGNANYEAVGKILLAYGFSILTDVYGDVPYAEANKAEEGNYTPVYDSQEFIYSDIIQSLTEANAMIITDENISGDVLYNGDMMKWKKFANSLKLRMLMRSSNVQDNTNAIAEMVSNVAEFPLMESNSDNAAYYYSGDLPDANPMSSSRGRTYEYYLGMPTSHLIDNLVANGDTRLAVWFDPVEGTNEYLGTDPGQSMGSIGRPEDLSRKDPSFFDDPSKLPSLFITSSEVQFLLAEAAESGVIDGDPSTYYDRAVSLSFEQWGAEMPMDFLTTTTPYDATNETLAIQKWISLYHNSLQGWMEWKRTGLPSFIQAGTGNVNSDQFPVRMMYPALEQSVNATNYTNASEALGGDNINSRTWWDKE